MHPSLTAATAKASTTLAALVLGVVAGSTTTVPFDALLEPVLRALLLAVPPVVFALVAGAVADGHDDASDLLGVTIAWYVAVAYLAGILATAVIVVMIDAPVGDAPVAAFGSLGSLPASGVLVAIGLGVLVGAFARLDPTLTAGVDALASGASRVLALWQLLYPLLAFLGGAALVGALGTVAESARIYAILVLIVLGTCLLWQVTWVLAATALTDLAIPSYVRYYVAVAPIPFATASEAASIPANVASGRRHLAIADRGTLELDFVLGGALNTPGSVINGVVFAGAIPWLLYDHRPSAGTLLVVGVLAATILSASPGVPGELVLLLPALEHLLPMAGTGFAAAWVSLQLGLPDGVRSTVNVTDDAIYAHFFERIRASRRRHRERITALEAKY